ncbi:MAG: hypothetical protein EHM58_12070 [Ignavibacteriae bacterium]|nr:MAG: hypothetical protein EHM58_12070 [Ignavibacteriota bacterium]
MIELEKYINEKFGIKEQVFLKVLKMSPGAEGYLLGSIGELLFKEYAESLGYDVFRIKEKPEGGNNAKSDDARGDFYIRKKDTEKDEWLVIECKGVKSNSEKRCGLIKIDNCINVLVKHSIERDQHIESIYKSGINAYKDTKKKWQKKNRGKTFPDFNWNKNSPGAGIPDLNSLWKDKEEIKKWIESFSAGAFTEEAFWNLKAPVRLLQTHMPSTRVDLQTKIKSTGPLKTEFNILCVDLFLKTGNHEFVFANSTKLNHQKKSPNHLQQNYTIDILVELNNFKRNTLLDPWFDNLDDCISKTNPQPRKLDKSQLDSR